MTAKKRGQTLSLGHRIKTSITLSTEKVHSPARVDFAPNDCKVSSSTAQGNYMPCFNETRIIPVEFRVKNFDLLEQAVRSLKYTVLRGPDYVSFYAPNGRITIREGSIDVDERDRDIINKLKQQYSRIALKKVSSLRGWALHETSKNRFLVRRR